MYFVVAGRVLDRGGGRSLRKGAIQSRDYEILPDGVVISNTQDTKGWRQCAMNWTTILNTQASGAG
jgi:hypothetical protein